MNFLKNTLKITTIGGIIYLLGRYGLHQAGMDFTALTDWLFRLVLVGFISWTVLSVKRLQNGYIGGVDGFRAGMWATLFLTIYIALGTWFFCQYISPTYTKGLEKSYRALHYDRMLRKQIAETWGRDTITQGAIDTVQRGLDMNVEKYTKHLFTTAGQVQASLFYSFFWGLATAITVAMLARKVKEE